MLENIALGFEGGGAKALCSRTVRERPESYPESSMFGLLPAYGLYCRHVEGLVLRNVRLSTSRPDLRHAVMFDDVKRLTIEALEAKWAAGAGAAVRLVQVEGAEIRGCKAAAGADPFLLVEGDQTRHVVLKANDLSPAAKSTTFGAGVSAQAVSSR